MMLVRGHRERYFPQTCAIIFAHGCILTSLLLYLSIIITSPIYIILILSIKLSPNIISAEFSLKNFYSLKLLNSLNADGCAIRLMPLERDLGLPNLTLASWLFEKGLILAGLRLCRNEATKIFFIIGNTHSHSIRV